MTISIVPLIDNDTGQILGTDSIFEQISSLFQLDYGNRYIESSVYSAQKIESANRSGRFTSLTAQSESGQVIGHIALIPSPITKHVVQLGQAIVSPEGRGKGILTRLVSEAIQRCRIDPELKAIYAISVTHHIASQRSVAPYGFQDVAFLYGHLPAGMIRNFEGSNVAHSTVVQYLLIEPSRSLAFVPPPYENIVQKIYNTLGIRKNIISSSDSYIDKQLSDITIIISDNSASVEYLIKSIGHDTYKIILDHEYEMDNAGIGVSRIGINLSDPNCNYMIMRLRERGYFFGGLLPHWCPEDVLIMQRTVNPILRANIPNINSKFGNMLEEFVTDERNLMPLSMNSSNMTEAHAVVQGFTGNVAEANPPPYRAISQIIRIKGNKKNVIEFENASISPMLPKI